MVAREEFLGEWSYNGAATTTVLFPRMNIHTGSDAIPASTVHGIIALPSRSAARLRKLAVSTSGTWGVTAVWLMAASVPSGTWNTVGILHTAAFPAGGAVVDVWASGGVPFTKVWVADVSGGPSYADETTDAGDTGSGDVTLLPATEEDDIDWVGFGHTDRFTEMSFSSIGGTAGTDGVVTWEYWNGSAWAALTGVTDGTTSFKAALSHGQRVTFTQPTDWTAVQINGAGGLLYYVRARVTTVYTVNPVYSHGYVKAPHTIPAGYNCAIGFDTAAAAHGDTRLTARFEAA